MQKKSIERNKDKLMSKEKVKTEIREKGITLVALVITIIVLLILVGITINSVIGSKVILEQSKNATNAYKKSATEENEALDYYANEIEKVSEGEETKLTKQTLPTSTNYEKYFADVDGNGTVDGVIFADIGYSAGSGTWSSTNSSTFSYSKVTSGLKQYYISKSTYTDSHFGTHPVISKVSGTSGTDRFYVMALSDFDSGCYCWYYSASSNGMSDYSSYTSTSFGQGKTNTGKMITKWNASGYGSQNGEGSYLDVWGIVQTKYKEGWFVPSKDEWSAFAYKFGITTSNYSSTYGLKTLYWSSSQRDTDTAWYARFDDGYMTNGYVHDNHYVRLAATF